MVRVLNARPKTKTKKVHKTPWMEIFFFKGAISLDPKHDLTLFFKKNSWCCFKIIPFKAWLTMQMRSVWEHLCRIWRGLRQGAHCPAGGAGSQGFESLRARRKTLAGGCWGTALWAQMSASIVGIFSSKPVVDSNTVHLFKAISNMSCLTSFKSYLTPRNSHEFTVRIKEENSQRERNYHFHFVRRCCL